MTITLYNTTSDYRRVNKVLNQIATAKVLEPIVIKNLISPILLIGYSENILNANYCYIDQFDRYYFIKNQDYIQGQRIQLDCLVDVRMSFDIESIHGMAVRSSSVGRYTIPDNELPIDPNNKRMESIRFPDGQYFRKPDIRSTLSNNIVLNCI